jgi:hypothetical protein
MGTEPRRRRRLFAAVAGSFTLAAVGAASADAAVQMSPAPGFPQNVDSGGYVATGDINGDGNVDLVAAQRFLLGNGDGTFAGPQTYAGAAYGARGITLDDLNGDGLDDIIATAFNGANQLRVQLSARHPIDGSQAFRAPVTFDTGATSAGVTTGDLDDDGKPDVIVATEGAPRSIAVFRNTTPAGATTPSFGARQSFTTELGPYDVATVDYDDDGRLDIVTANLNSSRGVSLLRNTSSDGQLSFEHQSVITPNPATGTVAVGDLTDDGKPDVLAGAWMSTRTPPTTLTALASNSSQPGQMTVVGPTGEFSAFPAGRSGGTRQVALGDLNGDGQADVVAGNESTTPSDRLTIRENASQMSATGAPVWSFSDPQTVGSSPATTTDLRLADFDEDGRMDIVTAHQGANGIAVYLNRSTPSIVGDVELVAGDDEGNEVKCQATVGSAASVEYRFTVDGAEVQSGSDATYAPSADDRGKQLRCEVVAANGAGQATAQSAPELIDAPVYVSGARMGWVSPANGTYQSPVVGRETDCDPGTWRNAPAPRFSYTWKRNGVVIEGADERTYTPVPEDVGQQLTCVVTGENAYGSAAPPAMSRVVFEAPVAVTRPSAPTPLLAGVSAVCDPGTWRGVSQPVLSVRWEVKVTLSDGSDTWVTRSTTAAWTPDAADAGREARCVVTAINTVGTVTAETEPSVVQAGQAPENVAAPALSGDVKVGSEVTCEPGEWSGSPEPSLDYAWTVDGQAVDGATARTYTPVAGDRGKTLRCEVTARNAAGSAGPVASAGRQVVQAPVNLTPPTMTASSFQVDKKVTCKPGTWDGVPAPSATRTYRWTIDGEVIDGATAKTYYPVEEDTGKELRCVETATSAAGETSQASAPERIKRKPLKLESPTIQGTVAVGRTVTCHPGTWRAYPAPQFTYQWRQGNADIAGATGSTFTIPASLARKSINCRVIATNELGSSTGTSTGIRVS